LVFAFLSAGEGAAPALAQDKKVAQQVGVDNSLLKACRTLGQDSCADFEKADVAAAAPMAKALERVWDKTRDYREHTTLAKPNLGVFEPIDKTAGDFLSQITDAKGNPADLAKVRAAYNL
jgi:hypothetical protein